MSSSSVFDGRVIFDHLQKTAGQAVNRWLQSELGHGCVTNNLIGEHRSLIDRYGGAYSVISGHVHFNQAGLDPRYKYMTCLREPIDRAISWLYFVTKNHTQVQLGSLWLEACQFLETEGNEQGAIFTKTLKNPYVEHFATIAGETFKSDEQKLASALDVIGRFDVWGLYEDMPGFMNDVALLLRLNAPPALPRVNLTKSRPAVDEISVKLRNSLVALNTLDIEFYRLLKVRYSARSKVVQLPSFASPWQPYSKPPGRTFVASEFNLLYAHLSGEPQVARGQVLEFNIEYSVSESVAELEIGIHIYDADQQWAFGTNTTLLEKKLFQVRRGTHRVQYLLVVDLPEGAYTAGFAFAEPTATGHRELAWFDKLVDFSVTVQRPQACVGYSSMPVEVNCWQVSESVKGLIEDFAGSATVVHPPVEVSPKEVFSLPCLLENASSQLWAGTAETPVRLSYHWHDALGELVIFDGERTDLPGAELAAGHAVEVQLMVEAPAAVGRYRLTVTPVQDGVCWFDERGFTPAVLEVNVVSATSPR